MLVLWVKPEIFVKRRQFQPLGGRALLAVSLISLSSINYATLWFGICRQETFPASNQRRPQSKENFPASQYFSSLEKNTEQKTQPLFIFIWSRTFREWIMEKTSANCLIMISMSTPGQRSMHITAMRVLFNLKIKNQHKVELIIMQHIININSSSQSWQHKIFQ